MINCLSSRSWWATCSRLTFSSWRWSTTRRSRLSKINNWNMSSKFKRWQTNSMFSGAVKFFKSLMWTWPWMSYLSCRYLQRHSKNLMRNIRSSRRSLLRPNSTRRSSYNSWMKCGFFSKIKITVLARVSKPLTLSKSRKKNSMSN